MKNQISLFITCLIICTHINIKNAFGDISKIVTWKLAMDGKNDNKVPVSSNETLTINITNYLAKNETITVKASPDSVESSCLKELESHISKKESANTIIIDFDAEMMATIQKGLKTYSPISFIFMSGEIKLGTVIYTVPEALRTEFFGKEETNDPGKGKELHFNLSELATNLGSTLTGCKGECFPVKAIDKIEIDACTEKMVCRKLTRVRAGSLVEIQIRNLNPLNYTFGATSRNITTTVDADFSSVFRTPATAAKAVEASSLKASNDAKTAFANYQMASKWISYTDKEIAEFIKSVSTLEDCVDKVKLSQAVGQARKMVATELTQISGFEFSPITFEGELGAFENGLYNLCLNDENLKTAYGKYTKAVEDQKRVNAEAMNRITNSLKLLKLDQYNFRAVFQAPYDADYIEFSPTITARTGVDSKVKIEPFRLPITGRFKVSVSTGLYVSGLHNETYVLRSDSTIGKDINGRDSTTKRGNTILKENSGNFEFGLATLGHGYYRVNRGLSAGLSIGATVASSNAETVNIRYLAGATLLFGPDQTIALTGGVCLGQITKISNKYEREMAQSLLISGNPTDLTTRTYSSNWFVTISINLRSPKTTPAAETDAK